MNEDLSGCRAATEDLARDGAASREGRWLAPNFAGILPELRAMPHWVLAKPVPRKGKITKPPFQPNGRPASHSNPATWSSFDAVREAYCPGSYIGIGYVLDGQPHFGGRYLHGFDWDDCISEGIIDPLVAAAVRALQITRLEVSISGTGLRGFFFHDELLPSRKTRIDGRSVELYSNLRYMTTTGTAYVLGASP